MPQPNNSLRETNRNMKSEEVLGLESNDFPTVMCERIQRILERKYENEEESLREWNGFWEERRKSAKRYERDILESYQKLSKETERHREDIREINKVTLRETLELYEGIRRERNEHDRRIRRERNEYDEDRREKRHKIEDLEEKLHIANRTIRMLKERHPEDEKDIPKMKRDTPDK